MTESNHDTGDCISEYHYITLPYHSDAYKTTLSLLHAIFASHNAYKPHTCNVYELISKDNTYNTYTTHHYHTQCLPVAPIP